MTTDLPVLWTPAQQAWLQAMGYSVLHESAHAEALEAAAAEAIGAVVADRVDPHVVAAPPVRPDVASSRQQAEARAEPPAARQRPSAAPAAGPGDDAQASGSRAARQPAVRLPDRLQIALLRASGCNPNDPATQALMDSWPLDTLRRDPSAKRALWPTLRALRRKGSAA